MIALRPTSSGTLALSASSSSSSSTTAATMISSSSSPALAATKDVDAGRTKNGSLPLYDTAAKPVKPSKKDLVNMASAGVSTGEFVFWFAMLFVASCTMTVGNKAAMLRFPHANTLTLLQNGVTVVALWVGKQTGRVTIHPITAAQWKIFSVNAILLVGQIVTSLQALPLVSIATVVAFRNCVTVAVAVCEYFLFGVKLSRSTVAALAAICVGMTVYAGSDHKFNATGYLWLLGNSVCSLGNFIWNRAYIAKYTKKQEQTSNGITFIQQVMTLPAALAFAVYNNESDALGELFALPVSSLAIVALTCAGGLMISVCYGQAFRIATATTVVVMATGNKAVAIVLGVIIFHTVLNGVQVGGLFVCIGGALWYAVEKKQKQPNFVARKVKAAVCPAASTARRKKSGSVENDV